MTTGIKLKVLREKKRLSQEELAYAIGVTQTTIGNWEHGKSIKHEYISKLAEALEVPVDYLLIENKSNLPIPKNEKESVNDGFEFSIKVPNHYFDDLNKKMDFLIAIFDTK
jgi:transcriptional regulator with XRE-family HTH domain